MSLAIDILSYVLIALGSIFLVIGAIGVLRFPDFYTRCHAAGITDSAGAGLMLIGLMLQAGFTLTLFKLMAMLVLLWVTSASSTHALSKSAYAQGIVAHESKEARDDEDKRHDKERS